MAHAPQESHIYDDPQWDNLFNSTHTESIEREAVDVRQNQAAVSSPEFSPKMEGRLFTAMDATISSDCKIHPTASLLYDDLPPPLRATFDRCPMYLEKHLDYVNYLLLLSSTELDKVPEASERERLKRLGIQIPTEEGNNKKWQCSVVGCKYKGTLQHLVSHLRTKAHLGIPMFACPLGCKTLFHHAHDRDRHKREETCIRSGRVGEAAGPQGSGRSLRGSQEQSTSMPKAKGKPRTNHHLVGGGGYQKPAQTPAHSTEDLRARKGVHQDPRFQASVPYDIHNHSVPSTSSAPPVFAVPLHQTIAYQQAQSPDVSVARQGNTRVHPAYHAPQAPDLFPMPTILPINHGGMHANSITNNHYAHGPIGNFSNPHAVPGLPPGVTYHLPHPISYPPQPPDWGTANHSNQHSYQTPDGRVQPSQGPPPYDLNGYPRRYGGRALHIDPQDPTTTIRDPSPFHGPQTGYHY